MSFSNKLPWVIAVIPLVAALYSGCGSSNSASGYDDGGAEGSSGGQLCGDALCPEDSGLSNETGTGH